MDVLGFSHSLVFVGSIKAGCSLSDTHLQQVTAYNFEKAPSNMDKGKRDEESFTQMRVGHVFTCFLNDFHFSAEKKDLFPAGVDEIPAHSIVDLHIAVTHNNSNGYGVKLVKIVPHVSSLYSYVFPSSLGLVPANAAACDTLMATIPETCKPSVQCFEQSGSIFWAKEVKCFSSKIDDALPYIRLTGVDDANSTDRASWMDAVDVPAEVLRKHTNGSANDDLYSMILLDVASKTGALSLLVSHDEYFAKGNSQLSTHRAVPVINVERLLSCVDLEVLGNHVGEQEALFALNCGPLGDIKEPAFAVSMEYARNPGGKPVECSDLSICHPQMQYAKGYKIQLVDLDDMGRSFSFVYTPNASAAPSAQQLAGQTKSYTRPYEEI